MDMSHLTPPVRALRTRADLEEHVDAYRGIQNGHGYVDLDRWFSRSDEFGRKPSIKSIARKMNRDPRTVTKWHRVWLSEAPASEASNA